MHIWTKPEKSIPGRDGMATWGEEERTEDDMQGVGKGVLDGNSPRDLPGQNHIIPPCSRDYHESITIQQGQGMAYHRRTACCTCLHENNGYQGFPLSLRRITEHVNEICWAHYGPDSEFPAKGVGQNWAKCFVEKHSDEIKAFWSHPLDHSCARAVNPYTKEEFFKLLEAVIEGDGGDDIIPPEVNLWDRQDRDPAGDWCERKGL